MSIVIVRFNSLYTSAVIDGRLPFIESGRSAIYLVPEDSATTFALIAKNEPGVKSATIYRYYKTYK